MFYVIYFYSEIKKIQNEPVEILHLMPSHFEKFEKELRSPSSIIFQYFLKFRLYLISENVNLLLKAYSNSKPKVILSFSQLAKVKN